MPKVKCLISLFILFSCNSNENAKNKCLECSGVVNENTYTLKFNNNSQNFDLSFNDSTIHKQKYIFDINGSLIEKRGSNFFTEEEVYFFDVNNTLKEFRKIVPINDKRKGVQEFIHYKNGMPVFSKSHFFETKIIDSTDLKYKIHLVYLGGFKKIKELHVKDSNFPFYVEEIDTTSKSLHVSKVSSLEFWINKDRLYNREFGFYQLSVKAFFEPEKTNQREELDSQSFNLRWF